MKEGYSKLLFFLAFVCLAQQCSSDEGTLVQRLDSADPSDGVDAVSDQAADQADKLQASAIKKMAAGAAEDAATMEEPDGAVAVGKVVDAASKASEVSDNMAAQQAATPAAVSNQEEVPDEAALLAQVKADAAAVDKVKTAAEAQVSAIQKSQKESAAEQDAHTDASAPEPKVEKESHDKTKGGDRTKQGFHMIPGLTIDSPALAKISGASLEDCIHACKTAEQCSGIQYSKDINLQGGNCLIMENRVQFSETFDYYERPGVTTREIKKTDQDMRKKWKMMADDDLGGLSESDIPGSKKIDLKARAQVESEQRVIKKASAAVAEINYENTERERHKVEKDRADIKGTAKQVQDAKHRVEELNKRARTLQNEAVDSSSKWKKSDLLSAQYTLDLSEVSKKSRTTTERLNEAAKKEKEYSAAASAAQAAGNPQSIEIENEAKKWKLAAAAAKADMLTYDSQRLKLKAKVAETKQATEKFKQAADWAANDHKDMMGKEVATKQLHKDALRYHAQAKARLATDLVPLIGPAQDTNAI